MALHLSNAGVLGLLPSRVQPDTAASPVNYVGLLPQHSTTHETYDFGAILLSTVIFHQSANFRMQVSESSRRPRSAWNKTSRA